MRANASLIASSLSEAREQAQASFKAFYGEEPFEIVQEEAESHLVDEAGRVKAWRCEFEARLGGEQGVGAG